MSEKVRAEAPQPDSPELKRLGDIIEEHLATMPPEEADRRIAAALAVPVRQPDSPPAEPKRKCQACDRPFDHRGPCFPENFGEPAPTAEPPFLRGSRIPVSNVRPIATPRECERCRALEKENLALRDQLAYYMDLSR